MTKGFRQWLRNKFPRKQSPLATVSPNDIITGDFGFLRTGDRIEIFSADGVKKSAVVASKINGTSITIKDIAWYKKLWFWLVRPITYFYWKYQFSQMPKRARFLSKLMRKSRGEK